MWITWVTFDRLPNCFTSDACMLSRLNKYQVKWAYFAALGLLIATTWAAGAQEIRFSNSSNSVVKPAEIISSNHWSRTGPDGSVEITPLTITLVNTDGSRISAVGIIDVPAVHIERRDVLRIAGTVIRRSPAGLTPNAKNQTRFQIFWLVDGRKKSPPAVTLFNGLFERTDFSLLTPIRQGSNSFQLSFVSKEPSVWRLQDLSITFGPYALAYKMLMGFLALIGLIFLLLSVKILVLAAGARSVVTCLIILGTTIVGITLSQPHVSSLLQLVVSVLIEQFGTGKAITAQYLLKFGHAFIFALMSVFLLTQRRKLNLSGTDVIVLSILLAWASEAVQRHHPTRSAEVSDILVDAVGILFAAVVYQLWCVVARVMSGSRQ